MATSACMGRRFHLAARSSRPPPKDGVRDPPFFFCVHVLRGKFRQPPDFVVRMRRGAVHVLFTSPPLLQGQALLGRRDRGHRRKSGVPFSRYHPVPPVTCRILVLRIPASALSPKWLDKPVCLRVVLSRCHAAVALPRLSPSLPCCTS
jgi:hypothetical protein